VQRERTDDDASGLVAALCHLSGYLCGLPPERLEAAARPRALAMRLSDGISREAGDGTGRHRRPDEAAEVQVEVAGKREGRQAPDGGRMRVGDDGQVERLHREEWSSSSGRPVRSLVAGTRVNRRPRVVIVPGLGGIGHMLDLLHACGAWTHASLLDLPGFGNRLTSDCPADLGTLTPVTAGCLGADAEPPVLLVGHSTGAQLALRAAAAVPGRVAGLVLIGLTFDPPVRERWPRLVPRLRTYLHERPRELVVTVPDFVRGGARVAQYLASALRDRPEDHLPRVTGPVLVLRGRKDTLCPLPWARLFLDGRADAAVRTLPGSHNVPYTHPGAVALQIGALARLVAGDEPGR
jgi:pimeloyl-ACP methyl ester carboxylesterase